MSYHEYRVQLQGRDFLSLQDFSPAEIGGILSLAADLKNERKNGIPHRFLEGRTLGMVFQKPTTRTRVSFEVGMFQLGGFALFLSTQDLQMGRGEPIRDTAHTLSRYLDGIMIRTFDHGEVVELAEWASVPVINGLTDLFHPCQALADLMTIIEHRGALRAGKIVFMGDGGSNVAHSLLVACSRMGMQITICAPEGYTPLPEILSWAREEGEKTGGEIEVTDNPQEAVRGAGVLYTDVWTSMGRETEQEERRRRLQHYRLDRALLDRAEPGAIVMHCLPANRGEEITAEVLESSSSVVFDQAENRLHVQKALMALIM